MQYNGGKKRIGKHIAQVVLSRERVSTWVEPFCGMCSVASEVFKRQPGVRFILSDDNQALINMLVALQGGWVPPTWISRLSNEEYRALKFEPNDSPEHAFIATAMSFGGRWWGGLAGVNARDNTAYFYRSGVSAASKIAKFLDQSHAELRCVPYPDVVPPEESVIYCDPPYRGTTRIRTEFDSESFAVWAESTAQNHPVYVSEYAPLTSAFTQVYSIVKADDLSKKTGGTRTERLYDIASL
jgi:DNA adenine methylase